MGLSMDRVQIVITMLHFYTLHLLVALILESLLRTSMTSKLLCTDAC